MYFSRSRALLCKSRIVLRCCAGLDIPHIPTVSRDPFEGWKQRVRICKLTHSSQFREKGGHSSRETEKERADICSASHRIGFTRDGQP
jgi:hypothetical protein